jgi:hypothetical protein
MGMRMRVRVTVMSRRKRNPPGVVSEEVGVVDTYGEDEMKLDQ